MRLNVTIQQHETITLTKEQIKEVTLKNLHQIYDIPKDFVIKKDNLYECIEYGGGNHSHEVDEWRRSVTKEDRIAIQVIDRVRKQ